MDYEKYKMPEGSYPDRPSKPKVQGSNAQAYREYADELEKFETAMVVFREKQAEYQKADALLGQQFWKDAFEELGIPKDHPKAEKLKSKAYDRGHSSGYSEIFNALMDLWELFE